MRIYHLSKSARDDLSKNVSKIADVSQFKSKDLKIAEADDPNFVMVFDETQKIFLGKKDNSNYFPLL